jgi:septum site-determining protein MinC
MPGGSESGPVTLRGTTKGFEILITSGESADLIADEIASKLDQAPGFFKGGDVTLRFDDAPPRGYLGPIEAVTDRYDLRIVCVTGPEPEKKVVQELLEASATVEPVLAAGSEPVAPVAEHIESEAVEAAPVESEPVEAAPVEAQPEPAAEPDGSTAKFIVGPVRSGCILEMPGHLVIMGDVNPGAEVRAAGSIVVLGRLRGIAHAGIEGGSAFILALQLEPQQLRIGSLVARAGDSEETPEKAEIAYAKNGSIMVDAYKGRLPFGIQTAKF